MPDQASTRYEQHDFPGFKALMQKLCPDCKVLYQNANADVAPAAAAIQLGDRPGRQGDRDRSGGFDRGRLAGAHGRRARASRVIAYDRPIPATPADYLRLLRQRGDRQVDRAIAGAAPEGQRRAGQPWRRARGKRLAHRRGRRPDPQRQSTPACRAAATRPWPSSTRPNGRRRRPSNGSAARSRASARRSSAWWPPTTAPRAAPSPPSRPPA